MSLPADEFLVRFLLLLPRGFVRIRDFGFLANDCRARLLPICFELLTALPLTARQRAGRLARVSWNCSECGGAMRVN